MKKQLFTVALAMASLLFVACGDDDDTPKKISQVFTSSSHERYILDEEGNNWVLDESSNDPKRLSETWTWEGDLLSKITYGDLSEEEGNYAINFEYNSDKKITRFKEDGNVADFIYSDGKLTRINFHEDGSEELYEYYEIEYKNGKVSAITLYSEEDIFDKKSATRHLNRAFLNTLLPDRKSATIISNMLASSSKDGDDEERNFKSSTFNITWKDNNITKVEAKQLLRSVKIEFTYDNKKNPYNGLIYFAMFGDGDAMEGYSTNNVTKITTTYTYGIQSDSESETISYTYNGDWPEKKVSKDGYTDDSERSVSTYTTYFVYK